LKHLGQRGELKEPKRRSISAKRRSRRPYGVRKPGDYIALTHNHLPNILIATKSEFPLNLTTQPVIAMYIVILLFFGFLLALVVYYLWKVRIGSDLDYQPSIPLTKNVGEQRRKDPRADINLRVSMETPDGTIEAEIRNISLGGAFICCKKPLPIGEVFRLTMIGPNNEPVIATAQVVWSNVNVPDEKVINRGMGVRFIKMSDRHIQFVGQILQESN
jgi:uncharacterized protein (TIGR02266 family)